jgi:2-methylcitrate dehydratase PrpD/succinate dehydrogenase hydrophobic anchor subunit
MDETRYLVAKCHGVRFDRLPGEVVDSTKYLLLDYLGVAARGALSESSVPVQKVVKRMGKVGDGAVIIGTGMTADPPYAALANGTAAHSLELDDVVNEASLHPAVAIMSAALGACHTAGSSGRDLIEGIVVGYEVMIRLGFALDPTAHYARGFHPTGTCGTMGSAVTAAKIMKLDREGMNHALGIAGSQAAASMEFLTDGAFTKRLHPGWAAHSGIIAALLAGEGFTGPASILEGKYGFLHAYSDGSIPSRLLENWGEAYKVMRTGIKPHACCRYKQGPIDGILEIMKDHRLKATDIEAVKLGLLLVMVPAYVLYLIVHPASDPGADIISKATGPLPPKAVYLLLLSAALFHGGYGVWTVVRDYVSSQALRKILAVAVTFFFLIFFWIGFKRIIGF